MRIDLLGAKEGRKEPVTNSRNQIPKLESFGKSGFFKIKSQFPQTIFLNMTKNIINDDLKAFPVGFAMVGGRHAFEVALRSLTLGTLGACGSMPAAPYRFSRRAAVSSTRTPELLESYLTREILVYQKIGNIQPNHYLDKKNI